MSIVIDSAPVGVVVSSPTPGAVPGTPIPGTVQAEALWQVVVCDRLGNELADLSTIAFDLTLNRGLNRPAQVTFKVPAWHAYTNTLHSDGDPYVEVGVRSIKVRRRDSPGEPWVIVFNGILWHLEDEGDEDELWTQITAHDPMIWWRFRPARAWDYSRVTKQLTYNGNFVTPHFAKPTESISAPEILRLILDNSSIATDPSIGEGPLGISVWGGTVEEGGPNCILDLSDTPYRISDIHKMLIDTQLLDAWIEPVDQVGSDIMGNLMAVRRAGTDKPWLHLQYGTGDYSCAVLKRERDMDTICNKKWDYLGPKRDEEHWAGNITKDGMPSGLGNNTGVPLPDEPPGYRAAVEARIDNSRAKYGVFMDISIFDANDNEIEYRVYYGYRWQMESYVRAEPRENLYATPTRNGPYDIFDLKMGDTIRVSAFDGIRRGFSNAVQRVFGYTVVVDPDMVEAITELETSPNAD